MKNIHVVVICVCIGLASCSKKEPEAPVVGTAPSQVQGYWVDEDTWRVAASGYAGEENLDKPRVQRQELACTAAKLSAMGIAMTELGGADSAAVRKESDNKDGNFAGFIRNGSVVEKTFDPETGGCEVVFEIAEKGLKAKVDRGK